MKVKLRLIGASYLREQPDVVVELFGRDPEGVSYTVLYRGFKPYFYIVEPTEELLEELRRAYPQDIVEFVPRDLWHNGRVRRCVKVVMHAPWRVPELRRFAQERGFEVLAADIPFHLRFIYDLDLGAAVEVEGEDVTEREGRRFTTDRVILAREIRPAEAFYPPLRIMSVDIETSVDGRRLYTIGIAYYDKGHITTESITGSETLMIHKFVEAVRRFDPDIITGYNIDGFDLPFLRDLASALRIDFGIGRDGSRPQRIMEMYWKLHGRAVIDVWWVVKGEIRPKRETLDYVAELLLGERKIELDRSQMDRLWEEDRERVIRYNLKDAELALKILLKLGFIKKIMDLAEVARLPFADAAPRRASTLIDSILIRRADREDIGIPMMRSEERGSRIEGAYVHEAVPGLHRKVLVMDFKSMYPSIIIKYNVCFTTLSEDGEIVSPIGVRFMSPSRRRGLVPRILEELMAKRDEIKRRMRETSDEAERVYLDGLQNAIKILMNSFYGVFASSFYRFTNQQIGASITAWGRETIKEVIRRLESMGHRVVYGDSAEGSRIVIVQDPSGAVKVLPICELFDELAQRYKVMQSGEKEVVVPKEEWYVLSSDGRGGSVWSLIRSVLRHSYDGKMFRVVHSLGGTEVTEDHGLILEDGRVVDPRSAVGERPLVARSAPPPSRPSPSPPGLEGEGVQALVRLAALYLSNGTLSVARSREALCVRHGDGEKVCRWARVLDPRARLKPGPGGSLRILSRRIVSLMVESFGRGRGKVVPEWMASLEDDLLDEFWNTVMEQGAPEIRVRDQRSLATLSYIAARRGIPFTIARYDLYYTLNPGKRPRGGLDVRVAHPSCCVYDLETEAGNFLDGEGLMALHNTDSVFFIPKDAERMTLEELVELGNDLSRRLSEELGIVLEFEMVIDPLFTHGAKKRYVGMVVWPEKEMLVRGYETRRTDSFDLQTEALSEVFRRLLEGDIDGAVAYAREVVQKVRRGEVPVDKLVISRSVRDFSEYKNPDSLPFVQAAKKMMKRGFPFRPGSKVSWVVTNDRKQPQEVEPYIPGVEFRAKPDYAYYARRLAHTLARVTEVFGVDESSLLRGTFQARLFEGESRGKVVKEKKEKVVGRTRKLEDFF